MRAGADERAVFARRDVLFGSDGLNPWLILAVFGLLLLFAGFFSAVAASFVAVSAGFTTSAFGSAAVVAAAFGAPASPLGASL